MTTTLILLILPKMMMKMMSRKRIFTPGRPWSARRASGDTLSIPLLLLHPASSSPSAVHIISHITVHIMNVNAMFKKWKKMTFSPLVDFRISQVFLEVLTYLKTHPIRKILQYNTSFRTNHFCHYIYFRIVQNFMFYLISLLLICDL